MIEKILKPNPTTFEAATVTGIDEAANRLTVTLPSGLSVTVDAAGVTPKIGDSVIIARAGRTGGRFAVQRSSSFVPGTGTTTIV